MCGVCVRACVRACVYEYMCVCVCVCVCVYTPHRAIQTASVLALNRVLQLKHTLVCVINEVSLETLHNTDLRAKSLSHSRGGRGFGEGTFKNTSI